MTKGSCVSSNLYGRNTETLRQVIRFAVLDIPYAAVRRYMSGEPFRPRPSTV